MWPRTYLNMNLPCGREQLQLPVATILFPSDASLVSFCKSRSQCFDRKYYLVWYSHPQCGWRSGRSHPCCSSGWDGTGDKRLQCKLFLMACLWRSLAGSQEKVWQGDREILRRFRKALEPVIKEEGIPASGGEMGVLFSSCHTPALCGSFQLFACCRTSRAVLMHARSSIWI